MYAVVRVPRRGGAAEYTDVLEVPEEWLHDEAWKRWFTNVYMRQNYPGGQLLGVTTRQGLRNYGITHQPNIDMGARQEWWDNDSDARDSFRRFRAQRRGGFQQGSGGRSRPPLSQGARREQLRRQGVDPSMIHRGRTPKHQSHLHNEYNRMIPNISWGGRQPELLRPGAQGWGGTQYMGFKGHGYY